MIVVGSFKINFPSGTKCHMTSNDVIGGWATIKSLFETENNSKYIPWYILEGKYYEKIIGIWMWGYALLKQTNTGNQKKNSPNQQPVSPSQDIRMIFTASLYL